MKLNLNKVAQCEEPLVTIEYAQMDPHIERVVSVVREDAVLPAKAVGGNQTQFIPFDAVYYFESVDKRTFLYLEKDVYEINKALSALEGVQGFVRIGKSHVVNIYKIESIKPALNMRVHAYLDNGEQLVINRTYKKHFENYLVEKRGQL
ncbi:LytTR family DNA-binding domain-containing protein [Fusibacter sp. JL298sf-3]